MPLNINLSLEYGSSRDSKEVHSVYAYFFNGTKERGCVKTNIFT
jgi:hypothetical protein